MKIRDKIKMDRQAFIKNGAITIVAFGDSFTYGAFEYGAVDFENVYWNVLKKMINEVRPTIPVNVINSGIGGMTALGSLPRLESQVLTHRPDLIIVAFALNDISSGMGTEAYCGALREIFEKSLATGAEVVFVTGTFTSNIANPIIGPPEIIFSTGPLSPPAASKSSLKFVPTGTEKLFGSTTASPVIVTIRVIKGIPSTTAL